MGNVGTCEVKTTLVSLWMLIQPQLALRLALSTQWYSERNSGPRSKGPSSPKDYRGPGQLLKYKCVLSVFEGG